MLYGRAIFLGILCVLFFASVVIGQQPQADIISSTATLPELRLAIINEIRASEDKMRDHIDKSEDQTRKYIDDKFSKLTDEFSRLDKEVAVLNNAKWYISVIIAPIAVYYLILLIQMLRKWNDNRKIKAPLKIEEPDGDIDEFSDNTQSDYGLAGGRS